MQALSEPISEPNSTNGVLPISAVSVFSTFFIGIFGYREKQIYNARPKIPIFWVFLISSAKKQLSDETALARPQCFILPCVVGEFPCYIVKFDKTDNLEQNNGKHRGIRLYARI
jgi:hypothetical protein